MLSSAEYYVDYENGDDSNIGTSADAAWKHCPGDLNAIDRAKSATLKAGDTVYFKGGVRYRGGIEVKWSGSQGAPIRFDGNTSGNFGKGPAIIDGSASIKNWKLCSEEKMAGANTLWNKIYYADIKRDANWRAFLLCDNDLPLPVAQWPNPKDPMFQDRVHEFHEVKTKLKSSDNVTVYLGPGTWPNKSRPASLVVEKKGSAVVSPIGEAAIHVATNVEHTITAFGISMVPQHTQVKDLWFYADKKLVKKVQLKKGDGGLQRFTLDKPIKVSDFGFKLASSHDKKPKNNYTAVKQVAAWNSDDVNVLEKKASEFAGMSFSDPQRLTAQTADYYNGMTMAVHGGHNFTKYLQVTGFDPKTHTLRVTALKDTVYKTTKYSLLNSVKLIDIPGEYAIEDIGNGMARVFVYPRNGSNVDEISYSVKEQAFNIQKQSHIVIDGFKIERQSGHKTSPIDIWDSKHVTVQNTEVTMASGTAGIHGVRSQDVQLKNCNFHHLPVKTRGLRFEAGKRCDAINCTIVKPTGTALSYVRTNGGLISGNSVSEFHGMHSNGLTFYVKCTDLIVERNHVFKGNGNVALTIQDAVNVVIKNNVIDADGGMGMGLWVATPFRDIRIIHNTVINSNPKSDWQTAIFSNNKNPEQIVVKNNILDGVAGNLPGEYSHNIFLRLCDKDKSTSSLQNVSAAKVLHLSGDKQFQLKANSPAIDAAADLDVVGDYSGSKRQGKPDIGAYEFAN